MREETRSLSVWLAVACLAFAATALADDRPNRDRYNERCDVVSLNGTARLLEGGRLEGTDIFTIIATGEEIEVDFSMVTLGTIEADQATGAATLLTSHDFASVKTRAIRFTTFDEIQVIPLGGTDPTCTMNLCGLIFRLKLETGRGRYNCGEVVSGLNPDPGALIPYTSYVDPFNATPSGDTAFLNSLGKLCRCVGGR